MTILRYPKSHLVLSKQDPFLDILDWLSFLSAKDYLTQLLQKVHSLTAPEARNRALAIIPHVRIASAYIHQSLDGPSEISFLPAYYAILNLMKVYILTSPFHGDLAKNRWHGATYDVLSKDSHSILTEVITIKRGGVFPLFYQAVTSKLMAANEIKLEMSEILPFVNGVTHEYSLATGKPSRILQVAIDYFVENGETFPAARVVTPPAGWTITGNQLKLLRNFKKKPDDQNVFRGKRISMPAQAEQETRAQLNTYLIYRINQSWTFTPLCAKKVELPEELPTALLFFYMSSIVRYKPEFFNRLRDSKFWPLVSAARSHAFHNFLLSFWSFMHQENYFIMTD